MHVVFVAAGVLDEGHPFAEAAEWKHGESRDGEEEDKDGKEGDEDGCGGETHFGGLGKVAGEE